MKRITLFMLSFLLIFSFATEPYEAATVKLKGAYVKSTYKAQGGRMNIEYHDLYLTVADARRYASKAEMSLNEAFAWFGSGFIKGAGPYLATIGFIKASEGAIVASEIRKYTDKNQSVRITIGIDKKQTCLK